MFKLAGYCLSKCIKQHSLIGIIPCTWWIQTEQTSCVITAALHHLMKTRVRGEGFFHWARWVLRGGMKDALLWSSCPVLKSSNRFVISHIQSVTWFCILKSNRRQNLVSYSTWAHTGKTQNVINISMQQRPCGSNQALTHPAVDGACWGNLHIWRHNNWCKD